MIDISNGYSVTSKEIPEVFNMWSDVFKFQKKFYNAPYQGNNRENEEECDLFWQECTREADEICEKYNTKLCDDILRVILDDINTRSKTGGDENERNN